MKLVKLFQYQGESFVYIDLPRNDGVKLVGVRPVDERAVRALTIYLNDEITVRKQQTSPKVTRELLAIK